MFSPKDLDELLKIEATDVLSLYLSTDPTQGSRQASHIWLKTALKEFEESVPASAQKTFRALADRVQQFIQEQLPQSKSLVLFAGQALWKAFYLNAPVRNEICWGRPSLVQLEWLLEEFRPYGGALVDSQNAKFFVLHLNEIHEEKSLFWEAEIGAWREKTIMPPSTPRGQPVRGAPRGGSHRDAFEDRMDEQVRRFWQEAAKEVRRLQAEYGIEGVVLGGPEPVYDRFARSMEPALNSLVIAKVPLSLQTPPAELLKQLLPLLREHERRREQALVQELLDRAGTSRRAGVGLEQTLQAIQASRAERVVVTRDLEASVQECLACGYVTATEVSRCAHCHAEPLRRASLRAVLPRLRRRFGTELEVLGGEAAEQLRPYGGIGALWRY